MMHKDDKMHFDYLDGISGPHNNTIVQNKYALMVACNLRHTRGALNWDELCCTVPFMKQVDFRHIAKQNILLVL